MSAAATGPSGPESQALSAERLAGIAARTEAATDGPWCADAWEIYQGSEYVPGVSLWIGETCRGTGSPEQDRADAAFVAHAREDVPALLARVAELESERHTTNEALSDAAERMRADRDRIAELEKRPSQADVAAWLIKKAREYPRAPERQESVPDFLARLASKVTRGAIRSAELWEDPHDGPLHHPYEMGRDLPETGGAS